MKDDYTTNSHYLTYTFLSSKGWENVLLGLETDLIVDVVHTQVLAIRSPDPFQKLLKCDRSRNGDNPNKRVEKFV